MAALAEFVDLDSRTFAGLPMPLTLRLPLPFSDMELIAFSRSVRPYQVERNADGELEIMSPNGLLGASFEAFVIRVLGTWADGHGGVVISSQGGYTLADTSVRMADASWISQARWSTLSMHQRSGFAPLSPDFLIEIASESDSRPKLRRKMVQWMENGAKLAWMIDPNAETVSIYRAAGPVEVLQRPDWVEADAIVTGFRLETRRLWAQ